MLQLKKAFQDCFFYYEFQTLREPRGRNLPRVHRQIVTLEVAANHSMQKGLVYSCFLRFAEEVLTKALWGKTPPPGFAPGAPHGLISRV